MKLLGRDLSLKIRLECSPTSYLDDWLDGAPQVEVNEDVVGLGSYGKTLTILFTDEDLEDEDQDDEDDD
jgi:hypothetical protein